MKWLKIAIASAGVLVALLIGLMQVYIAYQQKGILDRQMQITSLLGEMQGVSSWLPFLKDADSNVRYMTVIALERLGTPSTVAPLVMALSDGDEMVRQRAASALGKNADENVIDIVVDLLENEDEETLTGALDALVKIGYKHIAEIKKAVEAAGPAAQAYGEKAIKQILNEYALKKIGALESQKLVRINPVIKIAIVGAGVNKSKPDMQNASVEEYNYVEDSGEPAISTTMAARLIIGTPGSEIAGVAPGVKLISERVMAEGGTEDYAPIFRGMDHAIKAGVKIVYLEFGGSRKNPVLQEKINEAYEAGCIIIAPAGNANNDEEQFPAAMANVIAVAATTADDRKAEYSSYGDWVDITAPGNPIAFDRTPDSKMASLRGTSFAGSLVAGAAALIWSLDPSLTNVEVEQLVLESADEIDDLNPDFEGKLGKGRLNIVNAINIFEETKDRKKNNWSKKQG